jgi:predicted TPR repeat methyltransferase
VPPEYPIRLPVTVSVEEALRLAIDRHRHEAFEPAAAIYAAVLAADPEQADALHLSGVLASQQGDPERAIALMRRALAIAPTLADAHSNLGNVFRSLGDVEQAHACYTRAVALAPGNAVAHNNLGVTLRALGRLDEAEAALTRAAALTPDNADVLQNLGNVYRSQLRLEDAAAAYRQAIALRPYQFLAYKYLAYTLYALNDRTEALALIKQWLAVAPDNPTAQHLLAAYAGADIPQRATDDYIRETFGSFAESFDEILADLEYRAPQLVADVVAACLGPPAAGLAVLDLGCGTGLGAATLRPYASRLVGVDLSPEMLRRAAHRGLYDALCEAELAAFCREAGERFDLIVAADTLCYVGRLADAFAAVAGALAPGGLFVFTLEAASREQATGYRLNVSGRYSHRLDYAERALAAAGLQLIDRRQASLRRELKADVDGLIIAARRR